MAAKKNYSRYFIILQEDEKGFSLERDKAPSGYVKLEKKNDKCKISYYAQNLNLEKQPYYLVLVCDKKPSKGLLNLSKVTLDEHGKLDVCKEYDYNNVGDANIEMDKIVGAAIVKMIDKSVISIMSGFTSTDIPEGWKNYKFLNEERQSKEDVFDEYENKIEERKDELNQEHKDNTENEEKETKEEKEAKEEDRAEESTEESKESSKTEHIKEDANNENNHMQRDKDCDDDDDDKHKKHEKCDKDYPIGMVGDFFKSLVECYKKEKNLTKELKYCKWYHIDINNIEDLYDMSDYDRYAVVYYPMLPYYAYLQKYNHFSLGLKCNEKGKLQYLIYALPGDKTKDEQPFGGKTGFVTWVSCSDRPNRGYWLMFYDIRSSSVVVPVKKQ